MRLGLACSAAVLWGAAVAEAQVRLEVPHRRDGAAGPGVVAEVITVDAAVRPGGQGHVRVDLRNEDAVPHRVSVELEDQYLESFQAAATVEVDARGEVRVSLPLPHRPYGAELRLRADGGGPVTTRFGRSGDAVGVSALLVAASSTDAAGFEAMLKRLLGAVPAGSTGHGDPRQLAALQVLRPQDLPPSWTGIDGFDLVIVDARQGPIGEAAQRLLRDYLRAGGRLCALGVDLLPPGPLRAALAGASPGGQGFGLALALDSRAAQGLPGQPEAIEALAPWLAAAGGFLEAGARPTSGPLPPECYRPLLVPGVGHAPMQVFFLLILAFAVLVGPVNYVYWKRRRRLPMLLLTVPALGLGTTLVLLGYGTFREGFGIRSIERTLTILDQAEHAAVAWQTRTLFAGLSPSALRPRPDTAIACLEIDAADFRRAPAHQLRFRADGSIDGALLPSRTLTTLGLVSVGAERARLRFERTPDGDLLVLAGPGLAPRAGDATIVLRTPDGRYWAGAADGRLRPCDEAAAARVRAGLIDRYLAGVEAVPDWNWNPPLPLGPSWPSEGPVARFLAAAGAGEALRSGQYLAWVEDSPAADHLGLEAERSGVHLVLGRLGPEDLVD